MKVPFSMPTSLAGAAAAATIFASQLLTPTPMHAAVPTTYETANDIPQELFLNRGIIHGKVERVIDGDTIRLRHYPLYPQQSENKFDGKLSDHTIIIRLYGIDAPEIGKNGNPPMAFADEAKDYTRSKINGKIVNVKLLKKDQYSRVLGKVVTDDCFPTETLMPTSSSSDSFALGGKTCKPNNEHLDLSLGLAHNGFSTLYRGGGAEYDGNKSQLEKEIQFAQIQRKGVWTNGIENAQSPADYKKAIRESAK